MCRILLPINPEHVEKIMTGEKKFEYRKVMAKRKNIDRIIIYSTYPVMKVVGEVEVKNIHFDDVEKIWDKTHDYSGISKNFYDKYYQNKTKAVAYELGVINEYDNPVSLSEIGINYTPQSFVYMD